jgi:hypothetical protein
MKSASHEFRVNDMCRVLEVSRSGYYEWLTRSPSQRAQRDEVLSDRIGAHFEANRDVNGTRRLKDSLDDEGEHVSRRRIGRFISDHEHKVKN